MIELPTENLEGFILWNVATKQYFFRVYNPDKSFTDYDLAAEDIHIRILGNDLSLYQDEKRNKLSWSTKVLQPQPGQRIVRVSQQGGVRIEVVGHYDENLKFIPECTSTKPINLSSSDNS